jgi:hypothetical protein
MNPRWFQLIHFCTTRRYEAVTFPFVLGALRDPVGSVLPAENSRIELHQLLQMLLDETPSGYVLWIHRCGQIWQPVIVPRLEDRFYGVPVHSSVQTRDTLFVNDELFPVGKARSLGSLTEGLWEEFGDAISSGRFSIPADSRVYCPFSEDDLDIIEQSRGHKFNADF